MGTSDVKKVFKTARTEIYVSSILFTLLDDVLVWQKKTTVGYFFLNLVFKFGASSLFP